jgi:hypothetical protein
MASNSNRTDAGLLFTLRGNKTPKHDEWRVNASRVDALLESYIDTQFLLIEYSLENLRRQGSVRALNDDDLREFEKCSFMFESVQRLMRGDSDLASKNANHVARVGSLIQAVMQNDTNPDSNMTAREMEIYAELKIDEARRINRTAEMLAGWKQTSPKAAEPPPRDASMSDGREFRRPSHPRREVHSQASQDLVAQLKAKLARFARAAVSPAGRKQTSPKAAEHSEDDEEMIESQTRAALARKIQNPPNPMSDDSDPPRDASMSEGREFRRPSHPRHAVHSEAEQAVVAQLKARFAKRNAAAGVRTEAPFQILNPYVV